jgi:hypothetical protein
MLKLFILLISVSIFLSLSKADDRQARALESILSRASQFQNPENLNLHTIWTDIDIEITSKGDSKTLTVKEVFEYPSRLLMHIATGFDGVVRRTNDGQTARICREAEEKSTVLTPEDHPKDYKDIMETVDRQKLLIMNQLLLDYRQHKERYRYLGVKKLTSKKNSKEVIQAQVIARKEQSSSETLLYFKEPSFELFRAEMTSIDEQKEKLIFYFKDYRQITKRGSTPAPGQDYMVYPYKITVKSHQNDLVMDIKVNKVKFGLLPPDYLDSIHYKDPTLSFPDW